MHFLSLPCRAWRGSFPLCLLGLGVWTMDFVGMNSPPSVWLPWPAASAFILWGAILFAYHFQSLLHKSPKEEVAFHSLLKHKDWQEKEAQRPPILAPSILLGLVGPSESFPSSSWVPAKAAQIQMKLFNGVIKFSHTAATLYTLLFTFSRQLSLASSLLYF